MLRNKKIISVAVAGVLSVSMLASTAFAAMDNVTGYEKMKDAFFGVITLKNMTIESNVTISEDGDQLANMVSVLKRDGENLSTSKVYNIGTMKEEEASYSDGNRIVSKSSNADVYNVRNRDMNEAYNETVSERFDPSSTHMKFVNVLLDTLAGDTKNYFTYDKNEASLRLSENQVPELAQLGASVVAETIAKESSRKDKNNGDENGIHEALEKAGVSDTFLKLTKDVKIKDVVVNAKLEEDGSLKSAVIKTTVAGEDVDGNQHTFDLDVNVELTNVGSTVSDTIDISDKKVKTIERKYHD